MPLPQHARAGIGATWNTLHLPVACSWDNIRTSAVRLELGAIRLEEVEERMAKGWESEEGPNFSSNLWLQFVASETESLRLRVDVGEVGASRAPERTPEQGLSQQRCESAPGGERGGSDHLIAAVSTG